MNNIKTKILLFLSVNTCSMFSLFKIFNNLKESIKLIVTKHYLNMQELLDSKFKITLF